MIDSKIQQPYSMDPEPQSRQPWRNILARYFWALLIVGMAVLLRFGMEPYLEKSGFAIFLLATLVAGWICGIGPCLMAQTLILAVDAVWFRHNREPGPRSILQAVVSVSLYYFVGILVGLLSDLWHRAKWRAESRRRQVERQGEQLAAILCCLEDAVLVSSADRQLILMNPAAERLTGSSLQEMRGKQIQDVLSLSDERTGEQLESPVEQVQRTGRALRDSAACLLARKTGRAVPVAFTAAPIRDTDGTTMGVVVALHNETERRRAVEALRAADQRKDEFLATLGHELRNPLAPIRMGLELLKMSGDDPQECGEVRSMMERQCQQMVRLIDDLLDVSRITRGKLELRKEYVEVGEVVRNALDSVRADVQEAGHRLSVVLPQNPAKLFADSHRLSQVLSNLLSNAVKYTPSGGSIELRVEQQALDTVFIVTDTGIGVPKDRHDYIFEMFAQIKGAADSPASGLGIGLTLVKRLVEMHGGTVSIHSEGANCGTRFEVRIPLAADASAHNWSDDGKLPHHAGSAPRRLLVADDNSDVRKTLTMMLAALGHDVITAQDGLEAIEAANEYRPDAVLMDLGMPRLDGCEAAKRIRQERWGQDIVLIAITGWGQEDDRRRTSEAGFEHHLVKPVDIHQLRDLLDAIPARPAAQIDPTAVVDGCSSLVDGDGASTARHPAVELLNRDKQHAN